MITTRTRKNYDALYQTLVSNALGQSTQKLKEYKSIFRRKCDCCRKMRYTTSGDVFEFSFYCGACCDSIQPQKCFCGAKDILMSRKCLVCFNSDRKEKMPKNTVAKYFRNCHNCDKHAFVLQFDKITTNTGKGGVCVPCLEKPVKCMLCGSSASFFNKMCMRCCGARERSLSNNYFYPLTLCKDS
jgi:hypothetical protein